jgi:hypothetical protein
VSRSRRFSSWWSLLLLAVALVAASACTGQATEPEVEEPECIQLPGPNGPASDGTCVTMR